MVFQLDDTNENLRLESPTQIVTASMDGTVKWWNLSARGKKRSYLTGHDDHVLDIAMSETALDDEKGNIILSAGGDDRYMKAWSMNSGEEICLDELSMHLHKDKVVAVAITKNGKRGISGSHDNFIRFFDLERDEKEKRRMLNFGDDVWW